MSLIELYLNELNKEAVATRKVLGAIPESKFGWQPHPGINANGILAGRIAELPGWIALALTTTEYDLATKPRNDSEITTQAQLMELFEKSLSDARGALTPNNESQLNESWSLLNGATVFSTNTKAEVVRHAINQIIHHRALLAANLRMMEATVPEIYGTAAGDPGF